MGLKIHKEGGCEFDSKTHWHQLGHDGSEYCPVTDKTSYHPTHRRGKFGDMLFFAAVMAWVVWIIWIISCNRYSAIYGPASINSGSFNKP